MTAQQNPDGQQQDTEGEALAFEIRTNGGSTMEDQVDDTSEEIRKHTKRTSRATIAILVLTLILALIGLDQWRQNQQQNEPPATTGELIESDKGNTVRQDGESE